MAKKRIRDKRKTLVCFVCEKKILSTQKIFYFPIDWPVYLNIPIHRECNDFDKIIKILKNDEKAWEIFEKHL
ncbi:hypothetical protein LCGC14_1296620 [marine sediment metagenome]|uniref:Uncharacterized protein n=1 Tax=marine sediment metagenome TaxID=412755 RepID=A0A0F9KR31_9ZZZZ